MSAFRIPAIAIKLSNGNDVPSDIQILRTGSFYDPRYGKLDVTKQTLLSMVKNFDSKVRKIDLAIDYMHDSESIAAGWIENVYLSTDGNELWAKVSWTPNGRRVLSDKEFRYLSADFSFDYQDNETLQKFGPTLNGAGLTNRPVVKGMAPAIELQEFNENEGKNKMNIEELANKVTKLSDDMAKMAAPPAPPAAPAPGEEDLKKQNADLKAQLAQLQAQNAELAAKCASGEQAAALAEKKSAFAKMLAEKKAVPAQEEAFLAGDLVKFAELSGQINTAAKGHGGNDNGVAPAKDSEEASDRIAELADKKLSENKSLTYSKAVSAVLSENPDLAAKYRGQ